VPPKVEINFSVRCDEDTVRRLLPMEQFFESMAGARATDWGPNIEPPAISSNVVLGQIEVFVDLADLIDVEAEIKKKRKDLEKLEKLKIGKEKKLQNEKFLAKAPQAVVQKERDSLDDLVRQIEANEEALTQLEGLGKK
jgi:valyl-tRNA synthetase